MAGFFFLCACCSSDLHNGCSNLCCRSKINRATCLCNTQVQVVNIALAKFSLAKIPTCIIICCNCSYMYVRCMYMLSCCCFFAGKPLFQMSDLTDKRHESMCYIFQLCYRVIQHAQQDYRKNQVSNLTTNIYLYHMQ